MSLSREIISDRQVGSILASMAMSIPSKFEVVAGFVTFSELMAKPSSSHIAIMVVMLLVETGNFGGPTVK